MKRLIAASSLLSTLLLGCAGSDVRRIKCFAEIRYPRTQDQLEKVGRWPQDGYVFSSKTGQLYEWDEGQKRYVPSSVYKTTVVGDKLLIKQKFGVLELNFNALTAEFIDPAYAQPAQLKCLNIPIKHPVGERSS